MGKLTPEQYQEKQARRLKEATEDMRAGIMRVSESPMKKAAEKEDKMLAGITNAVRTGKWKKGLNRVSLEDWKDKTANKGVDRVAAGIEAAAPKVIAFAQEFLPYLDSVAAEVNKMPDVTLQDSIARMTKQITLVSKFKRKS